MIEQKDIDRLLDGRKIIDSCRSVATEYRDKASISIDSKLSADIAATKEAYQAREEAIKKMNKELAKIGFASQDEFFKFNQQLIIEEYKRCVDISFFGCKGCPTEKCRIVYGKSACVFNSTLSGVEEKMFPFFISLHTKSIDGADKNFADIKVCPNGYGFQWKINDKERFNLGWQ
mgnify:FL=1